MDLRSTCRLTAGIALLAATLASPVMADLTLTLDRNGAGDIPVEFRDDDHVRIGSDDSASRFLTSEGRTYALMASPDGKKQFAMDMDAYLSRDDAPRGVEPDLESVKATPSDRQETIGGITGDVYQVDNGGRQWELVLTDDPAMTSVTAAVYGAEIRMARMSGQAVAAQPLVTELALAQSLGALGILRGQLYQVVEIEDAGDLPDERFALDQNTLVISDWKQLQDAYH